MVPFETFLLQNIHGQLVIPFSLLFIRWQQHKRCCASWIKLNYVQWVCAIKKKKKSKKKSLPKILWKGPRGVFIPSNMSVWFCGDPSISARSSIYVCVCVKGTESVCACGKQMLSQSAWLCLIKTVILHVLLSIISATDSFHNTARSVPD